MKRRRHLRQPTARLAARQAPQPCSHRFSDWTWIPERARWEGFCKLCGWSHIASPEMAGSLERDVAAYCDSHPL